MTPMNTDIDRHCNDLTQLCSREQLSALMDGALPEDQTRFLLRRLRHDDELAGSWERWRLAGEVMRGLTPARRLPVDFAHGVATALHGGAATAQPAPAEVPRRRWQQWGGGAALAAALALVVVWQRPPTATAEPSGVPAAPATVATARAPAHPPASSPAAPAKPVPPALQMAPEALAAAAAVATRPARRTAAVRMPPAHAGRDAEPVTTEVALAQPLPSNLQPASGAARPWPRSVLAQYGAANALAVGFGEHVAHGASYNPFTPPVVALPPKLLAEEASKTVPAPARATSSAEPVPQP